MAKCENCGGHVSDQYKLVFADNQGTLHACPHCRSQTDRYDGATAGLNN
ncbi:MULTISPECIES: DUF7563 family protein [Saliphagus]|uniref:Small CPxCG-related zinc finger protein n=1 Tax=Saliphagus infecundisoli TaxID=1849069 RepID=A0ABD5QAQ3_9EURY|nr:MULTISPECIES: hypothetical protein [Saliphagus]